VVSWDSAQAVVQAVEERLGPIDILVDNAGVSRFVDFVDIDEAEWDRGDRHQPEGGVRHHPRGPAQDDRARVRTHRQRRLGLRQDRRPEVLPLLGLQARRDRTEPGHRAEVAPLGITVNTVCPGIVETPLKEDLVKQMTGGSYHVDGGITPR